MNAPTNRTPVLPHEKLRAALSDLAAARALNARLCATIEDLLPWAEAYAETQRVPLHPPVLRRIADARAALAAAREVTP